MDERQFFDNLAPHWDENEVNSTPERVERIIGYMDIKPGERVLDLGTGTGVLLPELARRVGAAGAITAVDYSEGMLSRAREKFASLVPKPTFLNMDFENETIGGRFDKIILYCVYPHLHTPIDTLRWLRAVNLNEEGKIYIAFPTSEEFINNIHRERHSESDRLLPAEELAKWLNDNGLRASVVSADAESYVVEIKKG